MSTNNLRLAREHSGLLWRCMLIPRKPPLRWRRTESSEIWIPGGADYLTGGSYTLDPSGIHHCGLLTHATRRRHVSGTGKARVMKSQLLRLYLLMQIHVKIQLASTLSFPGIYIPQQCACPCYVMLQTLSRKCLRRDFSSFSTAAAPSSPTTPCTARPRDISSRPSCPPSSTWG